jgi:hypothetical protein
VPLARDYESAPFASPRECYRTISSFPSLSALRIGLGVRGMDVCSDLQFGGPLKTSDGLSFWARGRGAFVRSTIRSHRVRGIPVCKPQYVPCALNEKRAEVGITCFGDRAELALAAAGGVLGRNEPKIGLELVSFLKSFGIIDDAKNALLRESILELSSCSWPASPRAHGVPTAASKVRAARATARALWGVGQRPRRARGPRC